MCVCMQDYPNALRVTVRGQATLLLITDKPTIKMENQTALVGNMTMKDNDNYSFDNPAWLSALFPF